MDRCWAEVSGYSISVDPLTWDGPLVVKPDINSVRGGRIVTGPLAARRSQMVHQRLVDCRLDGRVHTLRPVIFEARVLVVYEKWRAPADWFSGPEEVVVRQPDDVLSRAEQEHLLRFSEALGLEYGELDVVRDNASGLIYAVDANRTPIRPRGLRMPRSGRWLRRSPPVSSARGDNGAKQPGGAMRRVVRYSFPAVLVLVLAGGPPAVAPVEAASLNSLSLRATYDVTASFSWATRAVSVHTVAHLTNPTSNGVTTVAFNLATLRTGAAQVGVVTVRGTPVSESITDQTVRVPFAPVLLAGGSADVVINYTAKLQSSSSGYHWEFARLSGVLTAYRWIPWLSRTVRFSNPGGGEATETPTSSSVRVAITTDQPLVIAATGPPPAVNGLTQTFEAHNVRDFNFSAAPDYHTASRTTRGKTITFFYRGLPASKVLDKAVAAFNYYSDKVGDYPYSYLNIAEIGPWYSMESPGLFWIESNPGSLLAYDVVHETAHQWFYSTVGNDQALEPFADEAVAEFLSRDVAGNAWSSTKCPGGNLDRTIYKRPGSCYVPVVYYQGYRYLKAYRDHVGAAKFWQGLHNYYVANKFGIGGTRKLLDALDAASNYHPNHAARFPSLYP